MKSPRRMFSTASSTTFVLGSERMFHVKHSYQVIVIGGGHAGCDSGAGLRRHSGWAWKPFW